MRQDDEYGKKARNDYFSLFEEAYRNPNVRQWLEWEESEYQFENLENLHFFYSWITQDEDDEPEERRRIHNPRHVKILGSLLDGNNRSLIAKINRHELEIEAAEYVAEEVKAAENWRERLLSSLDVVKSLPSEVISEYPSEYHSLLLDMTAEIEKFMLMAKTLMDAEHESE